ncbi:LOW QUALITY PROTEIN: elongin-B-like [Convolutriloba macropyga]|uniref:LOW QUALITY PROTEIN: elongin-B-like n=1 Tax=Convolutriloba macropyga TaxID=536237 RepID=UPI003F523560
MDVYFQLRRQKDTIFTDLKETNTVLELKKTVQGIVKTSAEDIRIFNMSAKDAKNAYLELEDGTTLRDCGFDANNARPQAPAELAYVFKTGENDWEDIDIAKYSDPPEIPEVMRSNPTGNAESGPNANMQPMDAPVMS